jgi:hypothetical protein
MPNLILKTQASSDSSTMARPPCSWALGQAQQTLTANAVAPVAGTPSAAIVLVPGAVEILRFNQDTFFSGLSSAAATVYITPGQGL